MRGEEEGETTTYGYFEVVI